MAHGLFPMSNPSICFPFLSPATTPPISSFNFKASSGVKHGMTLLKLFKATVIVVLALNTSTIMETSLLDVSSKLNVTFMK